MSLATFYDRPAWKCLALAAFAAACAWLLQRNLGLSPDVFADEWYYSKMSRLQAFKDALVPSYLYLLIFRATNACGAAFYDCAHLGNVLLFAASAPFVYLVAREVAGKPLAAFLALLSLLAPINLYTAYFMPESTYYFGFCVLSWIALTRTGWHWAAHSAATGLALGLLSLVKVHALFLVPALCLFLVAVRWRAGGRWSASAAGTVAVALACVAAARFGLGYLLAGGAALNLFGNFYQGAVNVAGNRGLLRLAGPALVNGGGHLMALALLLPLPLAMILHSVLRPPARGQPAQPWLLQLYALLVLGAAAGVTILFTASVAQGESRESLRLHQRYYDFVFPLLWMVAAAALGKPPDAARPAWRRGVAVLLLATLAVAAAKLPGYWLNPVDGPELYALSPDRLAGRILLGVDIAILLLWASGRRAAAGLFLFAALPAAIATGTAYANGVVAKMRTQSLAGRAVAATLRHVPQGERGLVTVAGTDQNELMRAQFFIDHKDTAMLLLPAGGVLEQYQVPLHQNWLLVLGKVRLPDGLRPQVAGDGFALVHARPAHRPVGRVMFAQRLGGLVASAEGLSWAEDWGRWSDAKQVVLHFNQPLPRHVRVLLKAQAYDVNAELPFTMRVGEHSARFRLGLAPQEVALVFETDGNQRQLMIDVPRPVKPSAHGKPDWRAIGIGLSELEIGAIDTPSLATN